MLALLLLVGLRLFDRRRFPKNFLLIGLAMAVAGLANTALKATSSRPRPLREPIFELNHEPTHSRLLAGGLPVYEYAVGNPELAALAPSLKVIGPRFKYRSFPSGHAVAAFAWAAGLIYAFRGRRRCYHCRCRGFDLCRPALVLDYGSGWIDKTATTAADLAPDQRQFHFAGIDMQLGVLAFPDNF